MPVPKAVVYCTDSLATCEPDDPTEAFVQGIPNHPANHPSTLFLRSYKPDLIFLHLSSERYNHLCGNICSRLKNEVIRGQKYVYDK